MIHSPLIGGLFCVYFVHHTWLPLSSPSISSVVSQAGSLQSTTWSVSNVPSLAIARVFLHVLHVGLMASFNDVCVSRDEDGHPLDRFGLKLGRYWLDRDPMYDWTVVRPSGVTPEAAIRVNGAFASRCRGAY